MILPLAVIAFTTACWALSQRRFPTGVKILAAASVFTLGIALMAHKIPGFNNLLLLDQVQISPDGTPFTMYLNFDKALAGIIIIGFLQPLLRSKQAVFTMLKATAWRSAVITTVILGSAWIAGLLNWQPKISEHLGIFMLNNLFIVCVAEEAFFRGFLQNFLTQALHKFRYGEHIALGIAALLFGAAHFPGGIAFMILAAAAGLGYGWVYQRSKSIEGSILAHFTLNLAHFTLFTYPLLAQPPWP